VKPAEIRISAASPAGVFYAIQTLLQLLPTAIESPVALNNIQWKVPCAVIRDTPRFAYRGLMLDVSRNYMTVDSVKRLIELMSMQKMNRFHWHLTDNDGWRFESKNYPKLTKIGAYRKGSPIGNNITYNYNSLPNDTLYGGYYTIAQMKEVVAYAAKYFITVIPEIEMPAHAMAAIASYPFLSCVDSNGRPFPYPAQIQGEFCTRDEVFTFLDTILSEVMDIFPSEYIHIGGDEAEKITWRTCPYCQRRMKEEGLTNVNELQSYFIKRIEQFVNSKDRKIIGWDEIMQGGVAPNAAIMSWTGEQNGIQAAGEGHTVVMTPLPYCYFDHFQASDPGEPSGYPGLIRLVDVYEYNPLPKEADSNKARNIKGTQGNLWTEYVPTASRADYMLFPRAVALAEVAWTKPALKDYNNFVKRLAAYNKRLDLHGVHYSKHMSDLRLSNIENREGGHYVTISSSINNDTIYYTLDGSIPNIRSLVYTKPVSITHTCTLQAAVIKNNEITDLQVKRYILHKGVGVKGTLATAPDYNLLGDMDGWHNGSIADNTRMNDYRFKDEIRYNDDKWLGWDDKPFSGTLDFGKSESINKVTIRFFHNVPFGILIPKLVTMQTSADGVNFKEVSSKTIPYPAVDGAVTLPVELSNISARYLKIIAQPYGRTPAGNNAYLFVDEVIVE